MFHLAFASLLLGHVVGDFALQSRALVEAKRTRLIALLTHGALVFVAHLVAFAPFLSWSHWEPYGLLLAVALSHLLCDAFKRGLERRPGPTLRLFLLDQAFHVAVIWFAARHAGEPASWWSPEALRLWWIVSSYGSAYLAVAVGGSAIVRLVLLRFAPGEAEDADPDLPSAGEAIGILERMLALTMGLLDAWAGLGLLVAAKSIARFKDLEKRNFGEYYLIGTLASILVAVVAAMAMRLLGLGLSSP